MRRLRRVIGVRGLRGLDHQAGGVTGDAGEGADVGFAKDQRRVQLAPGDNFGEFLQSFIV